MTDSLRDRPNPNPQPPAPAGGFDLNHPTIISLLYLGSFVVGVTGLVGIVLAYVWRNDDPAGWEQSHYTYLIRTFWIGLLGSVAGLLLAVVLIGFVILAAVAVLVIVRCVLSLVNAQKQAPMPRPDSWLT